MLRFVDIPFYFYRSQLKHVEFTIKKLNKDQSNNGKFAK